MKVGIVASGPSATTEDARLLRDRCDYLIAVNDSWRLCKDGAGYFADCIYGTDMKWWKCAIDDIHREFDGVLWTQRVQWTEEPEKLGINCMESECKPDLCDTPGKIHTGQNSGFAAINLALHICEKPLTVILLGYDMQVHGTQRHHNMVQRPENLNVHSNYNAFANQFNTIDASKHGITILNASRKTALKCFPRVNLDEL